MNVTLDLKNHTCKIIREKCDKRFSCSNWASAESTFLYHVLQSLKLQGFDVIKKRMWKDGHMVDNDQQYIRTRKWTGEICPEEFAIYNSAWSVYDAGEVFNRDGEIILDVFTG
jgi:hypothetical protein